MNPSRDNDIGLGALLDVVWKHKWLVAAFAVLLMAATTVYTRRQPKIYEATTQLVIDLSAPRYLSGSGQQEVVTLGSGNTWNTQEFFETQYRIIKSRVVAKKVVDRLSLGADLDFLGVAELEDPEARARRLERADPVGLLVAKLRVSPVADSHVVLIKVRDRDPERAAKLADAVADAYAEHNVGRKVSAAGEAVTWLRKQSTQVTDAVKKAEDDLLAFKRERDILTASLADKQNLIGLNLQDAERQLREARQRTTLLRGELEQVRRLSALEAQTSVQAVLENSLIQRLKEQLVDLQNGRAELLKKYLDKHPDVRTADDKIKRVRKAIEREVAGVRVALKRKYQTALKAERELVNDVDRIKRDAREVRAHELTYKRLADDVDSKKQLAGGLALRLKEAELQAESRANNVRVLDTALTPTMPVAPRLMLNLAVALVLSLVGGVGLAFLVDQLDSTVKNQEQLEREFGLTFLGIIPSIRSARSRGGLGSGPIENTDRYVLDNPHSTVAECVRTIRTNLLFMAPEREMRSIVVTSAGPREGKTCTCVNIGATMAMAGSRTLLIDSDLRRPRLHKIFDMTNDRGLTNLVMDSDVKIADMVRDSGIEGMDVMCSGPLPPNPAELLHTKGFRRTLDRLLEAYDRIILDSPPVVAVTDAQILGMQVDGAVVVVRAGLTTRPLLGKAVRLLTDVNVNILGCLLNNLDVTRRGYGHYYYQYYGRYAQQGNEGEPAKDLPA